MTVPAYTSPVADPAGQAGLAGIEVLADLLRQVCDAAGPFSWTGVFPFAEAGWVRLSFRDVDTAAMSESLRDRLLGCVARLAVLAEAQHGCWPADSLSPVSSVSSIGAVSR
ncbi:MAG: hypothetical protein AB7G47_19705 [Mycolicibacterium sp.]|uniref:hypothetical protein n=1 Tax=Mycolicibacterium sp. TaxID=2320850 RepID=UPI003D0F9AC7